MEGLLLVLVVTAALGCGLMSGAFFAFSAFVMSGLKRLPTEQGAAAMQSINVTAVTPAFMAAFLGTAVVSLAAAVWASVDWVDTVSGYVLAGAGLYLLGVFAMTAAYHVPRNDRLATLDPGTDEAASYWSRYLVEWTRWNHVRAATALSAAAAFTIAARIG